MCRTLGRRCSRSGFGCDLVVPAFAAVVPAFVAVAVALLPV